MLCGYNGEQQAPRTTLDGALVAASTLWIMSRKELPIRFRAYPHANDNGEVSGSPPDPRLLCLARLIARAAVRDLIDGQSANDNVTVAGQHPLKGTGQVSATTLIAEHTEPDLTSPVEEITEPSPQSTRAPSLADLPAGTQLYLFPDHIETDHDS